MSGAEGSDAALEGESHRLLPRALVGFLELRRRPPEPEVEAAGCDCGCGSVARLVAFASFSPWAGLGRYRYCN
jgi:hypothetical protein